MMTIRFDPVWLGEWTFGVGLLVYVLGFLLLRSQNGKGVTDAIFGAGLLMIVGALLTLGSLLELAISAIVLHR